MKCAYHPDVDAAAMCVGCGRAICSNCQMILKDKMYCKACFGNVVTTPAEAKEEVTYNTALRVISGILCLVCIFSAIGGLDYYAESGLATELIVDIVTIIVAIACFLMAFVPQWVSAKLRIKLDKASVFGFVFGVLLVVYVVATALGPEPAGGWWDDSGDDKVIPTRVQIERGNDEMCLSSGC